VLESIDLRKLSEMEGPERAFVSLYLSGPKAMGGLKDREDRVRRLLADDGAELEHFEESMRLLRAAVEQGGGPDGPRAVFASWALDYVAAYPLPVAPKDLLWVDSSPYIRPLAELQDDYRSFVVVFADNRSAEIFLASADELVESGGRVRGDVKNHVKKGGWSQKRYQRRRAHQLLQYAKEVAQRIEDLVRETDVDRVVLIGSEEALRAIRDAIPPPLRGLVVESMSEDPDRDRQELVDDAAEAAREHHHEEAEELWAWMRNEGLKEGLAAFGPSEVLRAALEGRIDVLLACREAKVTGLRCRECELLAWAQLHQCPACRSSSVFPVDLVNEIVERVAATGGESRFTRDIPRLAELGGLAAALRWSAD
jgi:peptide chain release factor subunit 1